MKREKLSVGRAVIIMNDFQIMTIKPKDMQAVILSSIFDLQYWSYPALVRLYRGLGTILIFYSKIMREAERGVRKTQYTRFIRGRRRTRLNIPRNRMKILQRIYDTILANEGLYTITRAR